jgi:NTE family protein
MTRRPTIGLVLSGGGARGFAHIGVLRALEAHGIEVDVLAGTSMGALIAALYAHGYRADDIHTIASRVSWRDVIDLSLSAGLLKGEKLRALLHHYLPETFEALAKPLAVTCTDLEAGEQWVYSEGQLVPILHASSALPGAFEPVEHEGRTLADGGILNNLPVDALASMRPAFSIASDVTAPRRAVYNHRVDEELSWWSRLVETVKLERRSPLAAITFRSADLMMRVLTDLQYVHHPADLRMVFEMDEYRLESFWALDAIVAYGEAQANAQLEAQPALLAQLKAASGAPLRRRAVPKPPKAKRER